VAFAGGFREHPRLADLPRGQALGWFAAGHRGWLAMVGAGEQAGLHLVLGAYRRGILLAPCSSRPSRPACWGSRCRRSSGLQAQGQSVIRFEKGLQGSELWPPYLAARNEVELYPQGPRSRPQSCLISNGDGSCRHCDHRPGLSLPSEMPPFATRSCPKDDPHGPRERARDLQTIGIGTARMRWRPTSSSSRMAALRLSQVLPAFSEPFGGEALAARLQAEPKWVVRTAKADDEKC